MADSLRLWPMGTHVLTHFSWIQFNSAKVIRSGVILEKKQKKSEYKITLALQSHERGPKSRAKLQVLYFGMIFFASFALILHAMISWLTFLYLFTNEINGSSCVKNSCCDKCIIVCGLIHRNSMEWNCYNLVICALILCMWFSPVWLIFVHP